MSAARRPASAGPIWNDSGPSGSRFARNPKKPFMADSGSAHQGLASGEVGAEELVEAAVRRGGGVIDVGGPAAGAHGVEELVQLVEVRLAERARVARDFAVRLHVLDARHVVERERDLGG